MIKFSWKSEDMALLDINNLVMLVNVQPVSSIAYSVSHYTTLLFISRVRVFKTISGSAGLWRIAAMKEAGGWDDRTTAEDMDLAIRASLEGWKLVYVGALEVIIQLSF